MKQKLTKNQLVILGVIAVTIIFIFSAVNNATSDNEQQTSSNAADATAEPNTYVSPEPTTDSDTFSSTPEPTAKPTKKPKTKKLTKKQKIKKKKNIIKNVIEDRVFEEYDNTRVDHVTINENLGTKKDGDYIALVYLIWNVKNSASLSREVISMYSEDLAAHVGKKCSNVQEIAMFWTVPYLNDASAKCSYERKGSGMYEMDTMFGF